MGGASAKFMWDLLAERKRSEELEDRYSLMLRELQRQAEGDFIIGQNPKMKEVAELIARVAPTPTTVLIRGESGTGKELVARAIHRYSNLRDKPLVTVNCTALTPSLMESELFGHKRGAFTGAVADKAGLVEKADGGTIFLDEIGDMPPEMQSKLLRVLQAGEIKAVGRRGHPEGPRAGDRGHQPRSRARDGGGRVPRRPLLPLQHLHDHAAAPARARGGHPRARLSLPAQGRGQGEQEGGPVLAGGARPPHALSVARQSARAGERDRALGGPRLDPRGRISRTCRSTCRRGARSGSRPRRAFSRPRSGRSSTSSARPSPGSSPRPRGTSRWRRSRRASPGETSIVSSRNIQLIQELYKTENHKSQ